jgi:N-methylhydantoinase B
MRHFEGDIYEGDAFAINDPYAGGTHFSDVRLIRPIFADGKIIAFSQSNGHWSDVGGSVPGSFDVAAREMFREGLRITPVRLFDKGRFCKDVAHLIASNTPIRPQSSETSRHRTQGNPGLRARDPSPRQKVWP